MRPTRSATRSRRATGSSSPVFLAIRRVARKEASIFARGFGQGLRKSIVVTKYGRPTRMPVLDVIANRLLEFLTRRLRGDPPTEKEVRNAIERATVGATQIEILLSESVVAEDQDRVLTLPSAERLAKSGEAGSRRCSNQSTRVGRAFFIRRAGSRFMFRAISATVLNRIAVALGIDVADLMKR